MQLHGFNAISVRAAVRRAWVKAGYKVRKIAVRSDAGVNVYVSGGPITPDFDYTRRWVHPTYTTFCVSPDQLSAALACGTYSVTAPKKRKRKGWINRGCGGPADVLLACMLDDVAAIYAGCVPLDRRVDL